jgi:ABC-type oligopeptide transport system substrate-binding subunit
MQGVRSHLHVYPVGVPTAADIARARTLVGKRTAHAVLYTCQTTACTARARLLVQELARIGLRLRVHPYNSYQQTAPASAYDFLDTGWLVDEYDPINVFNAMFAGPNNPYGNGFDDPTWRRRVERAAALPAPARFAAFGRVELGIMRTAAPWASYSQAGTPAFFSARLGCVRFSPAYSSVDLAGLCIRR